MGVRIIEGAAGATFTVLQDEWSKDAKDYYYAGHALKVCDYGSLEVHDFKGEDFNEIALDNECVYSGHKKIPVKDRETFTILNANYTKDKHAVYFRAKILKSADPASFATPGGTFVGQDKNQCYFLGNPEPC